MGALRKIARNTTNEILLFIVIVSFVFSRYCYYGFHYYYQLDDYIQFHNLLSGGVNSLQALLRLGLLADRPLAVIGDTFVWSRFYPDMILGVLLLSALYAASGMLFRWVLARHFDIGYIFLVVYALLPLGMEGIYWMSAATRIVVGLFFASCAFLWFEKWCGDGKIGWLILYALFQLVSCGFYEQILIFTVASTLILAFLNRRAHGRRPLWGLLPILSAAIYLSLTRLLPANDVFQTRMDLVPPWSPYYWNTFLPGVLQQLKSAFLGGGFYTLAKGFKRGAILVFSGGSIIFLAVTAALAVLFFILTKKGGAGLRHPVGGLVTGLLMALAPLSIFFVVSNTWFSLRGTVTSYCGLALIVDILSTLLFSRLKNRRTVLAGVATAAALVFCIASVSELHDYRETMQKDGEVVTVLARTLKNDGILRKGPTVGILNLEPSYLGNQNYKYHEHIHGVTESNWALHGALECLTSPDIPDVAPLPKNPMYYPWNCKTMRLSNFSVLYLYDGGETMSRVRAVPMGGERYDLYDSGGSYIGYTWEEDGYGYLELSRVAPGTP